MNILKRIRPGSKGLGPVSQTTGTRRSDARLAPVAGMSRPGATQNLEGQSWPVALGRMVDSRGVETKHTIGNGLKHLAGEEWPDPKAFAPHEPDDPQVAAKLFGVVIDD